MSSGESSIDRAASVVQEAEAALDTLSNLPLNYTEREIVSVVRGVLGVAAAGLALAANHEHVAPAPQQDTVQQVSVAPPAGVVA